MKNRKCSSCGKRFTTDHGTQMHIDSVHHGKGAVEKIAHPTVEREESFAERAIQAQIDSDCGIYNPDQEWLLS